MVSVRRMLKARNLQDEDQYSEEELQAMETEIFTQILEMMIESLQELLNDDDQFSEIVKEEFDNADKD